jgi:hypothetical protein
MYYQPSKRLAPAGKHGSTRRCVTGRQSVVPSPSADKLNNHLSGIIARSKARRPALSVISVKALRNLVSVKLPVYALYGSNFQSPIKLAFLRHRGENI